MRIDGGVSELGRDQLLEVLGEDVLEHLGLVVDAVPGHPESVREEALDQAVMADDLECDAPSVLGEAHAAVGDMGDHPELAEPLEHGRDRARRDPQALGQGVGGDGLLTAGFQ